MEFFRQTSNGSILGLVPESVDSKDDLLKVIDDVDDACQRTQKEFEGAALERLKYEHPDPEVRWLAGVTAEALTQNRDLNKLLAEQRVTLKKVWEKKEHVQADLDEALKTLHAQAKVLQKRKDEALKHKAEMARLLALTPTSEPSVEVMPEGFSVGEVAVAEPDTRSTLQKLTDGYMDAWRDHPLMMGVIHFAGLALATSRSENRALQMDLEDALDDHDEALDALWSADDRNEELALEVEDKALALEKSDARRAELEGRSTTQVHVHEASRFTDGQLETLSARLEGRVDRSVQSELRTNTARYRGARGDRGTAGKQGRDGRDGKSTHTTNDVHHHHHPVIKSTTKPVEVRRVVQTLQPRTPPGGQTEGTRRLIESMNRLKRTDK